MDTDRHDVKGRLAHGEPNGTFAARDILMPGIFRIYGASRLRDIIKFEEMCNNLWIAVAKLPFHPDKDREHARSAFDLASRAELWRREHEIRPDKRAVKINNVVPVPGSSTDEATPIRGLDGRDSLDDHNPPHIKLGGRKFQQFIVRSQEICGELTDGA